MIEFLNNIVVPLLAMAGIFAAGAVFGRQRAERRFARAVRTMVADSKALDGEAERG